MKDNAYKIRVMDGAFQLKLTTCLDALEYGLSDLEHFVMSNNGRRSSRSPKFEEQLSAFMEGLQHLRTKLEAMAVGHGFMSVGQTKKEVEDEINTFLMKVFTFVKREIVHVAKHHKSGKENASSEQRLNFVLDCIAQIAKQVPAISSFVVDKKVMASTNDIDYAALINEHKNLEEHQPHLPDSGKYKIMLIETDPHIKQALRLMLGITGVYDVSSYGDTTAALGCLELGSYDAVVMNTILAGDCRPVRFLQELRKGRMKDIPVIMLNPIHDRRLVSKLASFNVVMLHAHNHYTDLMNNLKREIDAAKVISGYRQQLDHMGMVTQVLNNSDIVVLITEGIDRVSFVNKSFQQRFQNVNPKEFLARSCRDINLCQGGAARCTICEAAFKTGKEQKGTARLRDSSGVVTLSHVRAIPVQKENSKTYMVRFFSDVTKID